MLWCLLRHRSRPLWRRGEDFKVIDLYEHCHSVLRIRCFFLKVSWLCPQRMSDSGPLPSGRPRPSRAGRLAHECSHPPGECCHDLAGYVRHSTRGAAGWSAGGSRPRRSVSATVRGDHSLSRPSPPSFPTTWTAPSGAARGFHPAVRSLAASVVTAIPLACFFVSLVAVRIRSLCCPCLEGARPRRWL